MGRIEAFALTHNPLESALDGLGNGLGYACPFVCRHDSELFGSGSSWAIRSQDSQMGGWCVPNGLLVLSPGAFFLIAAFIWIVKTIEKDATE